VQAAPTKYGHRSHYTAKDAPTDNYTPQPKPMHNHDSDTNCYYHSGKYSLLVY